VIGQVVFEPRGGLPRSELGAGRVFDAMGAVPRKVRLGVGLNARMCVRARALFFTQQHTSLASNIVLVLFFLFLYFMFPRVLSKKLGKPKKLEWEVYCPRVIPTMTAFGLTFFVCAAKGNRGGELWLMCLRIRHYSISCENMLSVSGVGTR